MQLSCYHKEYGPLKLKPLKQDYVKIYFQACNLFFNQAPALHKKVSGQLPSRKIAPKENCPLDDCSWKIASKDNCPLTIYPWKLPPRKIAFPMICLLHNCPKENCPQEHCPKDKLHTIYFSSRIRIRSTLIDSCFLLFSFFVV